MPQDSTKSANGWDEEKERDLEEIRSVRRRLQLMGKYAYYARAFEVSTDAQAMANWLEHLLECSDCYLAYWKGR